MTQLLLCTSPSVSTEFWWTKKVNQILLWDKRADRRTDGQKECIQCTTPITDSSTWKIFHEISSSFLTPVRWRHFEDERTQFFFFSELKKLEGFKFEWRGTLCWISMVRNQELHSNVQVRTRTYHVSHSKKLRLDPDLFRQSFYTLYRTRHLNSTKSRCRDNWLKKN